MNTLLRIAAPLAPWLVLLFTVPIWAQAPRNVQASTAIATRNNITADLNFGSGRTLQFLSGSTANFNGTLGGTPTGGTLNLGSITLLGLTKSTVGLGNVDNTSDASKPISTATQTALDGKVSATAIDTVPERTALGFKSTTAGSPEEIEDHGNMGATETFNLATANVHRGVLDANLALTLTGFTSGKFCSGLAALTQDATGSRTVTWQSGVVGTTTLNPAANSITFVSFWSWDGGTTIFAQSDFATTGSGDASTNTSSSFDSEIALFSGTGGKTLKRATGTGYLKVVSGVAQTPASTVPIGDIGGLGTGVATALAVNVGSSGAPVVNGGALGTPSSGTLTNASGLPISGLVSSTSASLGLGSVELGHASDTTITRASAGEVAVEGNRVFRVGGSFVGLPDVWVIPLPPDETTAITTGTAKVTWRAPYACTVTAVRASLTTVSSSGAPTFDINEGGTTILSTKLTIDASEKTSTTAATAAVISDTTLADDAELTIDVDTAGTGAAGAKITIYVTRN